MAFWSQPYYNPGLRLQAPHCKAAQLCYTAYPEFGTRQMFSADGKCADRAGVPQVRFNDRRDIPTDDHSQHRGTELACF